MNTSFQKRLLIATVFFCSMLTGNANAGLLKWLNTEVIPTVKGERPLAIKPYVSFSHGDTQIKLSDNAAMVKVGGITVQTQQLKLRLAQAGCIATTGDVFSCAPDIVEREAKKLFDNATSSATSSASTLTFSDFVPAISQNIPLPINGGAVSMPSILPSPSNTQIAAFTAMYVQRMVDTTGNIYVEYRGGAIFQNLSQRQGGVVCYFSTGQGFFLDVNGYYRDADGRVAIGGRTTISTNTNPDMEPINLAIPWQELHLNPYFPSGMPIYTQCNLTIDNSVVQSTPWIPF